MIPSRSNPYRGGSSPKLGKTEQEEILALVKAGMKYKAISARCGVSLAYISTLARTNGAGRYGRKKDAR